MSSTPRLSMRGIGKAFGGVPVLTDVELTLEAMRPPTGEHRFRLELECANERYAVAEATLSVR